MLEPVRHQLILDTLKTRNTITIHEIIDMTHASESTIRRDLTSLENKQFLKRVHGGASRLQGKLQEPSIEEKSSKNLHEKRLIARYAASLIEDTDTIFLDAGSTTFEIIPFLPNPIVVVTNGLMHIHALIEKKIKTFLLGGSIKSSTNAMIGRGALESLELYRFDKCFMGVNGIHPQFGYTTPDPEEASIKQKAMHIAREAYVLADESKISEIAFAKIADLSLATLITNRVSEHVYEQLARKTTIKVMST